MTDGGVEVVRRMAEAFNRGGWQRVIDEGLLHPQVEYHDDRKWPEARSASGPSEIAERFDEVFDVLGKDWGRDREPVRLRQRSGADDVSLLRRSARERHPP
jgi:hypothetical protein